MKQPVIPPVAEKERLLRAAEERQRLVSQAIEAALAIGDLSKEAQNPVTAKEFIQLTAERINAIISFEACGFFVVDQTNADIELLWSSSDDVLDRLDRQMEYLIEQGYTAWAVREPRGIVVYSHDQLYRVLLHPLATYSRVRGVFVGLYPVRGNRWPHGARQAVSLILRNAAGALESLEYHALARRREAEMNSTIARRVDELHRRDQQLANARKLDAIGELAGGVAHQFNNALMVLTGNLELIKMGLPEMSELQKQIGRIDEAAKRMQDLAAKLLAYARGGKYVTRSVPVRTLIEDALAELKVKQAGALEFDLQLPDDLWCVAVDTTQMRLVLSAIVTNAVEAMEKGGLLRISVKKHTFVANGPDLPIGLSPGVYVLIRIEDDGDGIPENIKNRIFEPFFSTKFTGRGLSLAAVYGIVQNHHGAVSVDSVEGKGTTVCLYLPLADVPC